MNKFLTDGHKIKSLCDHIENAKLLSVERPYFKNASKKIPIDDFRCAVVSIANKLALLPTRTLSIISSQPAALSFGDDFFEFGLFVEIEGSEIDLSDWEQPIPWLLVENDHSILQL